MNTNKTILVGAILGMLVLTACATETGTPTTQPQGSQPTATSTGTLNVQTGEQPAVTSTAPVPAVTHSEADVAAYNGALQLNDATFCDKIKEAGLANGCKIDVSDAIALSDALTRTDATLCDKLSNADKIAACKIQLEAHNKAAELKQAKVAEKNEQVALYNSIFDSGKWEDCGKLTDPFFADTCVNNGILVEAVTKKDITVCNKIKDKQAVTACQSAYEQRTQPQPTEPAVNTSELSP